MGRLLLELLSFLVMKKSNFRCCSEYSIRLPEMPFSGSCEGIYVPFAPRGIFLVNEGDMTWFIRGGGCLSSVFDVGSDC